MGKQTQSLSLLDLNPSSADATVSSARRVMSFTGLDVLAEKPIDGLSKGMKQRAKLAQ